MNRDAATMLPRNELNIDEAIWRIVDDLDCYIDSDIAPLQEIDDNQRFFDHRREWARTDFENDGQPRPEWLALLKSVRRKADAAGWYRLSLPESLGGRSASNYEMAILREHMASRGLGLHNDLQTEHSVVGNLSQAALLDRYGNSEQRRLAQAVVREDSYLAFALTEPGYGSDATRIETTATRTSDGWRLNGRKRWNSGMPEATHDLVFARTSGESGSQRGITAFVVPVATPGFRIDRYLWTFNMPTDHADVTLDDVAVADEAILGDLDDGLAVAQTFVHQQRIRQAAASLGAAQHCVLEAAKYAGTRIVHGRPLSVNQGIQFPLAELHGELAMIRQLIRFTSRSLDDNGHEAISHLIAICNVRANRAACEAADRAIQVCGGMGYSRHLPFEHIYRHHRRYRITEGSDEIQLRRIAQHLFGY